MIEPSRRTLLTGLISLVAAPAIVRAGSLMPVRSMLVEPEWVEVSWFSPPDKFVLRTIWVRWHLDESGAGWITDVQLQKSADRRSVLAP